MRTLESDADAHGAAALAASLSISVSSSTEDSVLCNETGWCSDNILYAQLLVLSMVGFRVMPACLPTLRENLVVDCLRFNDASSILLKHNAIINYIHI